MRLLQGYITITDVIETFIVQRHKVAIHLTIYFMHSNDTVSVVPSLSTWIDEDTVCSPNQELY